MSRIKKTRSLKRIHKTKTGSVSKFKREARAAGHDRQGGKRVKNRSLSVYEKYLQEHPEAREQQVQQTAAEKVPAQETELTAEETKKKGSLLDQLDSKDFDDIY
ncbi:MAG: hypothetical protein KYX62_14740 [Pseudomonadota bacterium]|nr:hypothetical protein [Pseudomonadota bacterium]